MADIQDKLLTDRNDNPIPQHVNDGNKFEKTKGSDGAQHIKIVGSDGKPLSKIEMKNSTMEERLSNIEQKLDSVIENDAVNTQVTGSNVEDGIVTKKRPVDVVGESDITILAGTEMVVRSLDIEDLNIDECSFVVETEQKHEYRIRIIAKVYRGYGVFHEEDSVKGTSRKNNIPRAKVNYHKLDFRIKNLSDETQTYKRATRQLWYV